MSEKRGDVPVSKLRSKLRGIISVLRLLAASGQLSYLDRMTSALDPDTVKSVIYEVLRTYRAMLNSARKVRVKVNDEAEKVLVVLDWEGPFNSIDEILSEPRLAVLVRNFSDIVKCGKVIEEVPGLVQDKYYAFITVPLADELSPVYPSEEEIASLFALINKVGTRVVQMITALALSGTR